ncbi:MAG: NAD(P)-dependent oxidoreductase [Bryobacteraceae bacterium]|nr:NAD(P)-dependent oxidoreductase [Bryobacteraceae bacterium]
MTKHYSHSEKPPVGVLGLGLVGSALATRLLAAGYPLFGYDPAPGAIQQFRKLGGCPESSELAVARQCKRLVLSLPGSAEVDEVVARVMETLGPGCVVIDTTTGDPENVERTAREIQAQGAEYLDATLGGSSRQIAAGDAIVIYGATESGSAASHDLLDTFGSPVFHTGLPGSGTRMKLVLNLVLGLQRAVLAEGLEFARSSGIDPQRALEILKAGPAYATVMDTKGQKMLTGDFAPEARLAQHWKDVRLMLASAEGNGARLPLTQVHDELLQSAYDLGWGSEDNSAIIKVFQSREKS